VEAEVNFLADGTAARTMIGYLHYNVICTSVTLCTAAKQYMLQVTSE